MSQTFIFHEAGIAPGIPGIFAGVRLDIDDEGNWEVSPLERHSAYVAEEAVPLISTPQRRETPETPPQPKPFSTASSSEASTTPQEEASV